jgi:hypothetical protein
MLKDDFALSVLWDTYKSQNWWKKTLTFLPFVFFLLIFGFLILGIKNRKEAEVFDSFTPEIEDKIKKSIKESKKTIVESEKRVEEIQKEKLEIIKEYKEDEKNINGAGADFTKLDRIATELRARNNARRE